MQRSKVTRSNMTYEYGVHMGRLFSILNPSITPPFGGAIVEVEAGKSVATHRHSETEVYVILEGKGTMQVDDNHFSVGPNDLILIESSQKHGLNNPHDITVRFMAFWWNQ